MTHRTMIVSLLLLLVGYSLCWVSGNESLTTRERPTLIQQEEVDEYGEDSAIMRLQSITNLTDFLSLLEREDGSNVIEDDIVSNFTDLKGTLFIREGGRMATPDECSPRDTTVKIPFDTSNPNVVYFPRCTKIERCGGCCASAHLNCVPSYTERVTYKVVKAVVPYPGSSHLEWKGEFSTVILERHVNCRVQCTLTPDKCGPKKEFMDRQCECKCRGYERCDPPRAWDPEECECKCAEVLTCCKNGESCGLTFVKATCECGVESNEVPIINVNITQEDIGAFFETENNTTNNQSSSSSAAPTLSPSLSSSFSTQSSTSSPVTATTTTTAETATSGSIVAIAGNCPPSYCPRGYTVIAKRNGDCECRRLRQGQRNTVSP